MFQLKQSKSRMWNQLGGNSPSNLKPNGVTSRTKANGNSQSNNRTNTHTVSRRATTTIVNKTRMRSMTIISSRTTTNNKIITRARACLSMSNTSRSGTLAMTTARSNNNKTTNNSTTINNSSTQGMITKTITIRGTMAKVPTKIKTNPRVYTSTLVRSSKYRKYRRQSSRRAVVKFSCLQVTKFSSSAKRPSCQEPSRHLVS